MPITIAITNVSSSALSATAAEMTISITPSGTPDGTTPVAELHWASPSGPPYPNVLPWPGFNPTGGLQTKMFTGFAPDTPYEFVVVYRDSVQAATLSAERAHETRRYLYPGIISSGMVVCIPPCGNVVQQLPAVPWPPPYTPPTP